MIRLASGAVCAGMMCAGILCALLTTASPARATGVQIAVAPETLQVAAGDTFTVQLRVPVAGSAFNGYNATIDFDPAVLKFLPQNQAAQEGALLRDSCFSHNVFYTFSSAADSLAALEIMLGNGCATTGPGTLLKLRFTALAAAGLTHIRVRRVVFYNDGIYVLPVVHTDATVLIGAVLGVPAAPRTAPAARLWAEPNPSRGSVALWSDRALSGASELRICDVSGRLLRRLPAGSRSGALAQWDGCDDAGRMVAPGVYSAVVLDGPRRLRAQMVRVR